MNDYKQYSKDTLKMMLYNAKRTFYDVEKPEEKQGILDLVDSLEDELYKKGLKYADISMIGEIRTSVGYIGVMDKSVIFKTLFDENGEMESEEVVGWYFGRPNEEDTKKFSNGSLKAEFK